MTKPLCQGRHAAYVGLMMAGLYLCPGPLRTWADDFPERPRGGPPPPASVPQQRPDRGQPPADPPLPTLASDEEDLAAEALPAPDADDLARAATRTALNPLLIRDRRHRLLLSRGDECLRQGSSREGFAHLQALLDAPHDAFYWPGDSSKPRGTQAHVVRRLQSLAPDSRREYDRLHGPTAQVLFDQYRTSGDRRLLLELFRRFGQTEAARTAAVHELLIARDAGRTRSANEWARLLIADDYHWSRLSPAIQSLISTQLESAQGGSRHVGAAQGADVAARSGTELIESESVRGAEASPLGPLAGAELSPPFPIPLWSVDFLAGRPEAPETQASPATAEEADYSADLDRMVGSAFQDWLAERVERRLPIVSANEAIVAGGCVIVRGLSELMALDLRTGELHWKYRCAASLIAEVARRQAGQDATRGTQLDFDVHFSGNPVFGRLSTDGHRIFLLDRVPPQEPEGSSDLRSNALVSNSSAGMRSPNRLIALPVRAEGQAVSSGEDSAVENRPLWTRGEQSSFPGDDLAGHVFLGCPLCVDNRVFVLAEADRQISLIALEAATGRTLWTQGVALARRNITADSLRAGTACTPLYSQGIVVCPTEVGLVVGVDAITGRLQWVYDHTDEEERKNFGRWIFNSTGKTAATTLPSHTFVHAGRVLHLPRISDYLHCIDAASGEGWKTPRLGAQAIGCVTAQTVLLLGDRTCRAVALADGCEQWVTTIPEPIGLGLVMNTEYVLPTAAGYCVRINLASGQIEGRRFNRVLHELAGSALELPQPDTSVESDLADSPVSRLLHVLMTAPAGNLVPTHDVIVARTARGVAVFPQARPKLERVRALASTGELSAQERLTEAELLLLLGKEDAAAESLEKLLRDTSEALVCEPAERLLQEVLYAQLPRSANPRAVLDRLRQLADTDPQRVRLLVQSIDVAIALGDPQLLIAAVHEFQALPDVLLASSDEDGYVVSSQQCVWERLSQLRADETSDLRGPLEDYLVARGATLQHSGDIAELERFVRQFVGWTAVSPRATQLARYWMETGRLQQAELLLLSDRFPRDPLARMETRYQLADLYAQQGLTSEALYRFRLDHDGDDRRSLPQSLVAKIPLQGIGVPVTATVPVAVRPQPATWRSGINGPPLDVPTPQDDERPEPSEPSSSGPLTFVALENASGGYRTALAAVAAHWSVDISEHRYDADTSQDAGGVCDQVRAFHREVRRRIDPRLTGNLVVLDQFPLDNDRTRSRVVIGDRDSGVQRAAIEIPAAFWKVRHALTEECGHVMVIGGESAFGLSLLEGKLLWTVRPASRGKKPEKVHVGPVGSDYCVLQTSDELRVVEPATGRTLWVREHLPPSVGLQENELTGVIGDSSTLVVFDADHTGYTVYHMQSGRKLRRGSLEAIPDGHRRQRWGVGRRLVDLVSTKTETRLLVWDSRDDRVQRDIPIMERLVCRLPDEGRFAYVTSAGRLQILNVAADELAIDTPIPLEWSRLLNDDTREFGRSVVAFADQERLYVNLVDTSESQEGSTAATEMMEFPHVRVRGRLLALERSTGEILWERPVADACIPLRADVACPILLLLRREREGSTPRRPASDNDSASLIVEVLDVADGRTLAQERDLGPSSTIFECPITVIPSADGLSPTFQMNLLCQDSRIAVACRPSVGQPHIRTAAQEGPTLDR